MKKIMSVLLALLLTAATVVTPLTIASAADTNELGEELITNGDFEDTTKNAVGANFGGIAGTTSVAALDNGKWYRATGGLDYATYGDLTAYDTATHTGTKAAATEYAKYFTACNTVITQPDDTTNNIGHAQQTLYQAVDLENEKTYSFKFKVRTTEGTPFIWIKLAGLQNKATDGTVKVSDMTYAKMTMEVISQSEGFALTEMTEGRLKITLTNPTEWTDCEIVVRVTDIAEPVTSKTGETLIDTDYTLFSIQSDTSTVDTAKDEDGKNYDGYYYRTTGIYLDDVSIKEVTYLTNTFGKAEVYDVNGNILSTNDYIYNSVTLAGDNYSAKVVYPEASGLTFKGWYKNGELVSEDETLSVPTTDTSIYVPRFVTKNLAYASASFESYAAGTSLKHTDTTTDFPANGQWGGIKTAGYRGKTVAGTFYDNEGNSHTQSATGDYSDATTTTISTDYAYSGNNSLYFSGSSWAFGSSIENVTPGKTYTVSYRIKRNPSATARTTVKATAVLTTLNIGNGSSTNADFCNHICNLYSKLALSTKKNFDISSDNWELISMEFTVPENATDLNTVYLVMDSSGNGATTVNQFYIDDLVVLEKQEEINLDIPVKFYNAKGTAIESPNAYAATEFTVNDDNTVDLTVKYIDSFAYEFMGWYDESDNLVSTEATLKSIPAEEAAGYIAKIKDTNIYTAASYEGYSAGTVLTHTDTSTNFPVNGQWGGFAWAGYRKQTVAGTVYDNKGNTYTQVDGGSYSNGITATVSDTYAHSGTKSLLLSGAYWTMVGGINNVKAGKTYEFSFWAKKDPTLTSAAKIKGVSILTTVNVGQSGISDLATHITELYNTIGLPWDDGKYYQSNVDISSGEWVKLSTRFTVPEAATDLDTVYLSIDASGNDPESASKLYIDDISVSEVFDGIKTAYNDAAAIRTAAASSTGKNGLRIYNKIQKAFIEDYNIVEYGSIVTATSLLNGDLTLNNSDTPYVKGVAYNKESQSEALLWDATDTANIYTAYLTGISEARYDDDYIVRAYAIDSLGSVYYGEPITLSVYDVVAAIDNGNGVSAQTDEDIAAFTAFAGGQDGKYTMYDNWLKTELKFAGKLRNIAKAEDTLSGEELTKALEVDGYYEPLFERAIANEGNQALLKAMFEKAERGEDITVVGFGGSITQKAACTSVENSYSYLVKEWLQTKFPNITVNYKNAGIGSTTSVLGIARMGAQVMEYDPDLVLLDFTTNDQTNDYHAGSYEAILRTLAQNNVAVITITYGSVNNTEYKADGTCHKNGNREALHGPVMLYNDVPVIDYFGVMWDCYLDADGDGYNVESDVAHWKTLWADYIHPTEIGHKLSANAINYYLQKVYNNLDNITDSVYIPDDALDKYTENFMGSVMYEYTNEDIDSVLTYKSEGVTNDQYINEDSTTKYSWYPWTIEQGEYIEFTIPKAKMFAFLRVQASDTGTAEIYINNAKVATDNSHSSSSPLNWMNFIRFFDGEDITVKILCTSGTYYVTTALIAKGE